jgi:hypothetical protein
MPLELAEEWSTLEAALGARPAVRGKDVLEIRESARKLNEGKRLPEPSATLSICMYIRRTTERLHLRLNLYSWLTESINRR